MDFRRKKSSPASPLVIDGRTVEIVQHFKYLGSTISSNLKLELNVFNIVKKAQQRLYFLRRLRSFGLTTQVMLNFYRAVIESVLIFSITVWFRSITQKETLRLHRVVKTASRIIGRDLPSLEILYQQRPLGRAIVWCMRMYCHVNVLVRRPISLHTPMFYCNYNVNTWQ